MFAIDIAPQKETNKFLTVHFDGAMSRIGMGVVIVLTSSSNEDYYYLSHMTRGHRTRRTQKYEYPTRDTMTLETGHGGHVLYIYIKKLYIYIYKLYILKKYIKICVY